MLQIITAHLESTLILGILLELLNQTAFGFGTIGRTVLCSAIQLLDFDSLQADLFVERLPLGSLLLLLLL